MGWLKTIIYGLISGLTEFFPVSLGTHQTILSILFGLQDDTPLQQLLIRIACLLALLICCRRDFGKLRRENRIAKIPARRRTRPADQKSIMTVRLVKVAVIPLLIGMLFYGRASVLADKLYILAILTALNGFVLFVPLLSKTGNKDSRNMSPMDALLIGLGGALGAVPGISSIGAMLSVASVRGVEKGYALSFGLLLSIPAMLAALVFDAMALRTGVEAISALVLVQYLLTMAASFLGAWMAISAMRSLAAKTGISGFSYYCWGAALFTLILYLTT